MATDYSKILQATFKQQLKDRGFIKTRANWNKHYPQSIGVFNLQRSHYSPAFYINLGVYFPALGANDRPNAAHCHILRRMDEMVPDRMRLHDLLNFERSIFLLVRQNELRSAVTEHALPWIDSVSTFAGAAEYAALVPSKHPFVKKEARVFLGLAEGPNNSFKPNPLRGSA